MTNRGTQQINIEEESHISNSDSPRAISWFYTLPFKSTSFYLIVSIFGALVVWLALNYLHSYVLAVLVIFGLVIIIGKSIVKQELNFFCTDEYVALDAQQIAWSQIKSAVLLPYNEDYLISFHSNIFPYFNMYVPVPKKEIQEIIEFISKFTEIKDFKTQTIIDRLVRFLIF